MAPIPEFKLARPPRWDERPAPPQREPPRGGGEQRHDEVVARRPRRDRLEYMPALDGLRAVAVIAVLAYHASLTWARAGFLGVDIFFVISGYLITALLLAEWRREGTISLLHFWKRRALRLLPSLLVMLAAVAVAAPILAPDQVKQMRGDLVAALTYVSNWRLILQDVPYFEAMGRPPLLQHLWSLAVEEQFYLLWPLILLFVLKRKGGPKGTLTWVVAAAALSALAMALMYSPESDVSRVYYGTDTRVGTILLGAALAFVWMPGARTATSVRKGSIARDLAGLAALAALGWIIYSWTEFDPFLYRGGFVVVALLAAVVVAVCAHPGRIVGAVLGSLPLRWMGKRSYAIYLWHWPVFMLTRPDIDIDLSGYPLLGIRFAVTLALAVATHHLIERPVARDALGKAWRGLREGFRNRSPRVSLAGAGLMLVPALVACGIGSGIVRDPNSIRDPNLLALEAAKKSAGTFGPIIVFEPTNVAEAPGNQPSVLAIVPGAIPASPPPAAPPAQSVTAVGDSVMLIARDELVARFGSATIPANVDAAIGRQAKNVIETTRALKDAGQLGNTVIVHTGTNGPITMKQLEQLMELLKDVPRVFLVNVKVARPWESFNNKLLSENVGRWPNAKLLDWNGVASAHPEVFYTDGVHLKPSGMRLYVDLLSGGILG